MPEISNRFTIDGSEALEQRLRATCEAVAKGVLKTIPETKVEAIVLGGGYGRGQGGVFITDGDNRPYNDMEFYVFTRGNRIFNTRRYTHPLNDLGERLSPRADLHVEFKIDTLSRLRESPTTMFSYDLVSAHKIVWGDRAVFHGCDHHLDAARIPLSEGTRLLFNRCTGLLLAKEKILANCQGPEDLDFINRNIAKAQLALGDVLLVADGRYHWSCLERHRRLAALPPGTFHRFSEVVAHHKLGVRFKLQPWKPDRSLAELSHRHEQVSSVAKELWLWLENRRLNCAFRSTDEYAASPVIRWDSSPALLNYALNLRTFGLKAALDPAARHYPRERLLRALPQLLWRDRDSGANSGTMRLLHARGADWANVMAAYKEVWPSYG